MMMTSWHLQPALVRHIANLFGGSFASCGVLLNAALLMMCYTWCLQFTAHARRNCRHKFSFQTPLSAQKHTVARVNAGSLLVPCFPLCSVPVDEKKSCED